MALNPEALAAQVHQAAAAYSRSGGVAHAQLCDLWAQLSVCPELTAAVGKTPAGFMVPRPVTGLWEGAFVPVPIYPVPHPYRVGAVDGSQVYPDHHEGVPFFLVHTATVSFEYGATGAESKFSHTSASVVHAVHEFDDGLLTSPVALVDRIRTECELRAGLELDDAQMPIVFDGALVFWHLSTGSLKSDPFFWSYITILQECAERAVPTCWYTSLPQGRDFVNLLRVLFSETIGEGYKTVIDTDLLENCLPVHYRTALFFSDAQIAAAYPELISPVFFYFNTGDEIARVEIPAWMAADRDLVDRIAGILLDQCMKGRGYPICIAEAHEHAVVRSHDRDLFFSAARRALEESGQGGAAISRKSMHKRRSVF